MSHRRQRSAGATKYDPATDEMTISLAWHAFEHHGWEQFSATVRHELIYTWQYYEYGEANHGVTFDRISQSGNLFSDAQVHYQSNKICKRAFRDR
ncbi:SprT-like domain-containing protein [Haladaptatus halobius]|uniref:SprT-like domain-containing protein n=1 Tax=Haladaptatus halobius TaxID=2884875 RepID=UPI00210656E2|nr:SprT-like domain-containing protein [Haladaptatus halobius]